MSRKKSIHSQVSSLIVGLTTVISFLYFAITFIVAFAVEDRVIHSFIKEEAKRVAEYHKQFHTIPIPANPHFHIYKSIESIPSDLRLSILDADSEREIFTPDEKHYHYRELDLGYDHPSYIIAEVSSLLAVSNNPSILILFLMGFLVVLIISIFCALWLSKAITNPVVQLTNQVSELSSKIESSKSSPSTHSEIEKQLSSWYELENEIGTLTARFKMLFGQLQESLKRESEFSTDVSHELRTPMTIIKNAVELIKLRGLTSNDLVSIEQSIQEIETTTETLLGLARAQTFPEQYVYIRALIEDSIVKARQARSLEVELKVDRDLGVSLNPQLFNLLIHNLIENASKYSSDQKLIIDFRSGDLIFENLSNKLINDRILQSVVTSNPEVGIGQGLFLTKRILDKMNIPFYIDANDGMFSFCIKI